MIYMKFDKKYSQNFAIIKRVILIIRKIIFKVKRFLFDFYIIFEI